VRQVAPKLLLENFITSDSHYAVAGEGWSNLANALKQHGRHLSLPERVSSAIDIVPLEIQHQLWLQYYFDASSGLGQEEILTLEDEQQHYLVKWFVECLQEHRESVAFLDFTLESMLELVILPSKNLAIFIKLMLEEFHLEYYSLP
jgi:hypothetical protein